MSTAVALVDTPRQAAVLLQPVRLRILELLREPDSAASVARHLDLPRQRVAYHVKELEKEGLLHEVGERRRGNCIERLVQASARHYLIAPEAVGPLAARPEEIPDRFSSAYLVATAARTIRDVAALRRGAHAAGKPLPTLTMQADVRFGTPADRDAFAEELADCLARLAARHHAGDSSGGRVYRFAVSGYPAPPDPGGDGTATGEPGRREEGGGP